MRDLKLEIHVLATGSKGNATLVSYGENHILIDAGISCRRLVAGMKACHVEPTKIGGIFITHEHADHVGGLAQFLKRFPTPVYTRKKTWMAMHHKVHLYEDCWVPLTRHSIEIGRLVIEGFPISHDAADPAGFVVYTPRKKMTYLTDTGVVTTGMLSRMDGSDFLVLEANHDEETLYRGAYPEHLKYRIASPRGHLSNTSAAEAIAMMKKNKKLQVVLAHRSEENNTKSLIKNAMVQVLERAGLALGKDIFLQHGEPETIVSMKE